MKLITLGTSHGDPELNRFNSSLLLRSSAGDYIFEAGAPVNALLIRKNIPFSNIKAVFVSHSHEDHTGGLPGLVKSLIKRPVPGQHTRLLLPEQECIDALKAFVDSTHRPWTDDLISTEVISSGTIYDDGNLRVTAFATDHMAISGKAFPSWAFLAEAEGKRIVFTGDLSRDLHDFPIAAFDAPALCVMECQHYNAKLAGELLKKLPVSGFIGVHISSRWNGHANEFYRTLGSPDFPFAFAEDGMEFDLDLPVSSGFSVAVLADLHLPDADDTVKEQVLDWTVSELKRSGAGLIAAAGDMTGTGSLQAARRLRKKLKKTGCRYMFTPGNSDLRSAGSTAETLRILGTPDISEHVILLDSSQGKLSRKSRILLAGLLADRSRKNLLAITHYPPENLPEDDAMLLTAAARSGIINHLVYGHMHHDKKHIWKGLPCECLRGLDPDKASGGAPSFAIFSRLPDKSWQRKNKVFRTAVPSSWSRAEKQSFIENLGLSAMKDPFGTLDFAISAGVPVLEWRFALFSPEDMQKFKSKLADWRKNGGRCLSIHFPDIRLEGGSLTGTDILRIAVKTAIELEAQRITLHVPRVTAGEFADDATASLIADETAEILAPLAQKSIATGVENLHMSPGEKSDLSRGFGYTPQEVISFADMLTRRGIPAGIHLDIGHARNNAPFSKTFNISDWFAICGSRINGMHLHQVTVDESGKMLNHRAFTEPFGKLISLASLFTAWKTHAVPHVPLILEIRQDRGPESLELLRTVFK